MSIAPKSKAVRNITLSLVFLVLLVAISIFAHDKSIVGVAVAFAAVLGIPVLLLSIADFGRALKIEHGGNYRATLPTRMLSHYRAAGGAICISAAAYTLFRNVSSLVNGTSTKPVALQLLWVVCGVALALLGFLLIIRAFAKESNESSNT